ncbi:MAG: penicillin-binding transpeptidase domain-containing protein [Ornithinimicrobium sp.]
MGVSRVRRGSVRNVSIGPIWALIVIVLALGGLLLGRLVQWQVVQGGELTGQASAVNTRQVITPALRGRILASDGTAMVGNEASMIITLDPAALNTDDQGRAVIEAVASELDLNAEDMWGRTQVCGTAGAPAVPRCFNGSPYQPIPIALGVDPARALSLLERPDAFAGVAVATQPVRTYPMPKVNAAHLVGYLGRPTAEEVGGQDTGAAGQASGEAGLSPLTSLDRVGRAGLEATYDDVLRGEPERTVVTVDPRGVVTGQVEHRPAVPGLDLRTHLESKVQIRTEAVLAETVQTQRRAGFPALGAAAVVIEVDTGAVIAAASWPTYDPSIWSEGISQRDFDALLEPDAGQPLVNRVLAQTYPPASTFKAMSLPAALASGIDPEADYDCPGSVDIAGQRFDNFESRDYGPIDLQQIMEVSCDTVFYQWAYDSWLELGGLSQGSDLRDPYVLLAEDFGFAQLTGIDVPGEVAGSIPGRETSRRQWEQNRDDICARADLGYPDVEDRERRRFLERSAKENCVDGWQYRPGDAVNFAIGQGELAVTPVQLATSYAAIANGGTLWRPQIAAGTQRPDGTEVTDFAPEQTGRVFIEPESLQIVRDGLAGVNTNGTGAQAFTGFDLDNYPVAGKTGSAEAFDARSTAWYASYGPTTTPEYAVAVVVDQGGIGGEVAAPAARQIWEVLREVSPLRSPPAPSR